MDRARYWDEIYATRGDHGVSWFEPDPATSMTFVRRAIEGAWSAVDVGGGASRLADVLLDESLDRVAVLDVSAEAEGIARASTGSTRRTGSVDRRRRDEARRHRLL